MAGEAPWASPLRHGPALPARCDHPPTPDYNLFERTWVYGTWMKVVVTLSPTGKRVIVASDLSVLEIFLRIINDGTLSVPSQRSRLAARRGIDPHDRPRSLFAVVRLAVFGARVDGAGG